MREIKFRGKRVDNGEWVYGYLCACKHCLEEEYPNKGKGFARITSVNGEYGNVFVLPITIGQYTGLKDKNGVEIYEGDLVNFEAFIIGEKDITGEVKQLECCWMIDNGKEADFLHQECSPIEVIGNIHEEG